MASRCTGKRYMRFAHVTFPLPTDAVNETEVCFHLYGALSA
jgi:hypothetical protein